MQDHQLHRCLTALDLTLLGIGAIIGAGVFVLTGIAAATKAGPAVTISYILAGCAALFASLAYAEMAASIGGCGSAYQYTHVSFGKFAGWIIGWALILEYTVSVSAVAIGWSGYMNNALEVIHHGLPKILLANPTEGGLINLPAFLIVMILSILLSIGVKESTHFNTVMVIIKLSVIAIFIVIASLNVKSVNWHPFAPFGWNGIAGGAAIVFFAYIGFDAVSTAAEETINPQKNLPIGIITSVFICTLIYIVVALLLTGIMHYTQLNVSSPVAEALLRIGYPIASGIIAIGAIAGLTTVMLVMYYGLTRILLAMARDGFLPPFFASIHYQTHTPIKIILLSGLVIALIAGFVPLDQAAAIVNIGTLSAFTFVCGGVIAMRHYKKDFPRPFKIPFHPLIPVLGILLCLYLMFNLSVKTWIYFIVWNFIGMLVYLLYSRKSKTSI